MALNGIQLLVQQGLFSFERSHKPMETKKNVKRNIFEVFFLFSSSIHHLFIIYSSYIHHIFIIYSSYIHLIFISSSPLSYLLVNLSNDVKIGFQLLLNIDLHTFLYHLLTSFHHFSLNTDSNAPILGSFSSSSSPLLLIYLFICSSVHLLISSSVHLFISSSADLLIC